MNNRIICVVGPTASGKTSLAINIAKSIDGEIICADSMQIYKYFNIGTAKPTPSEQTQVPHHLFDFLEPSEEFSVAQYVKLATEKIYDIKSRGKVPIITGGTGLYIDSLIRGSEFAKNNDQNEDLRQELMELACEKGNEFVHNMLKEIDIESYNRLHPNDVKRVVRAIEVFKITGKTISEHNEETKKIPPKFNATIIGINPLVRQTLYDRINLRVDLMIENGLLDELKEIIENGNFVGTALQAIGYKELLGYINQIETLENCIDKMKQESRRYAKRQVTWFNKNPKMNWLTDIFDSEKLLLQSIEIIEEQYYGES